jgi:hypothetical protein
LVEVEAEVPDMDLGVRRGLESQLPGGDVDASTDRPVFVASSERPLQKVMQSAVVGDLGELTYRLDLSGFPGDGWAFSYCAELAPSRLRPRARRTRIAPALAHDTVVAPAGGTHRAAGRSE